MKLSKMISRNKSGILSMAACVGVAVTAALTYLGTIKATETVKQWTEEKHGDPLTRFETVQATTPHLVPAAIAGAATIGCIVASHKISKKEVAAIAGVAAMATKQYDDYRNTNIEANGMDAHERVLDKLGAKKAKDAKIYTQGIVYNTSLNATLDKQERLFYDTITGTYFTSTIARVMDAEYHINRVLTNGDLNGQECDVDTWCNFLGIPNSKKDNRGWCANDDFLWLDFNNAEVDIGDGMTAIFIECTWSPIANYWDCPFEDGGPVYESTTGKPSI